MSSVAAVRVAVAVSFGQLGHGSGDPPAQLLGFQHLDQRLAAAGYVWAFTSLTASKGARAHYDRRRSNGDHHISALRDLFNHMIGCLHHCLNLRVHYGETIAFPTRPEPVLAAAV